MKRSMIVSLVALMTISQSIAHAQIMDLPDPGDSGSLPSTPQTPSTDPGQGQAQYAGSVRINAISRKTGGVLYTMKLQTALQLERIDLRVVTSKVKIHEALLVYENGQRIEVQNFRNSAVLETGSLIASESLNSSVRITAIEIRAESYSAEADVMLTAVATSEVPKLSVVVEAPVEPVAPTPSEPLPQDPDFGNIDLDPYDPPGGGAGGLGPIYPDVYQDFSPGELVLFDTQLVGIIVSVYGTQVEIRIDGRGVQVVDSTRLEKAVSCYEDVCQGDTVQYSNQSAEVLNAFPSGRVHIAISSGRRYVVDAVYLSAQARCDSQKRFCVGDAVLYQNQYSGYVSEVFADGTLQISINGNGYYRVTANQLAKSLSCSTGRNAICINERVIYQNRGAYVVGVYANGLSRIAIDGQRNEIMVQTANLAKRLRCLSGFCVGQKVFYGKEKTTIKEIYSNNTARITLGVLLFKKDYIVALKTLRY